MNKNFNLFFSVFLIGMFALLFLRQVFVVHGFRTSYYCQNVPGYTQSQCTFTEGPNAGWKCTTSSSSDTRCLEWETRTGNCRKCIKKDECGYCQEWGDETCTYRNCIKYETISVAPEPTTCYCYQCIAVTPCQRCLTNAPQQQAVKSCQCLELKPKKDSANNLSFECLVKGSKDAQITDYTVSFKSPSGNIVNLNSNKIDPIQCPSSVGQDSTCYQVETTAITAPAKGTYEMVVPPQISCQ